MFFLNGLAIVTLLKNLHNRLIPLGIRMLSVQFQWSLPSAEVIFIGNMHGQKKPQSDECA